MNLRRFFQKLSVNFLKDIDPRTTIIVKTCETLFGIALLLLYFQKILSVNGEYLLLLLPLYISYFPVLVECFFIIFSLRAREVSTSILSFIAILLAFLGVAIFEPAEVDTYSFVYPAYCSVILYYMFVNVYSYYALGRSISVLPALKIIKSNGPYSHVRHPVYACYIYIAAAFLILSTSWQNIIGFVVLVTGLGLRIYNEEKLLSKQKEYSRYKLKVHRRLFHHSLATPLLVLVITKMLWP